MGVGSNKLTDAERDQIEADAEIFIKTCSDTIKALRDQSASALFRKLVSGLAVNWVVNHESNVLFLAQTF